MILDSSAMVAILLGEPGAQELLEAAHAAPSLSMSAATYLECAVVIDRRSAPASRERFDRILAAMGVEIVAFTAEQAALARGAYARYGEGGGHPAGLNLGDCFSYALSAATGEPLLFVGDDFTHTDVARARHAGAP